MTLTINLKAEETVRLRDLASAQGIDAQECARRIIEERLAMTMDREEIDARLHAAGVRPGDRQRALAQLDAWSDEDENPDGTVEEWDEIQRNIERGTNAGRSVKYA